MSDNGRAPTIGLVVRPSETSGYPVALVAGGLVEHGWDAHILCDPSPVPPGGRLPRIDTAAAVARGVRRRPLQTLRHVRPGTGPPHRSLRALSVRLAPQLVHLPSSLVAGDWIDVARTLGARTVVSVRGDEAGAGAVAGPHQRVWAQADALHVESDAVAAVMREHAAAETVRVVAPAPDPLLLADEPAAATGVGPLRILGIGPLSWAHGYEHALAGVRLLVDRGVRCEYRIVGRGPHLDAISFARHQLGLDGCVEIVEPGAPEDIRDHLRWAGVVVDAAVVPTSPKTILDAQAAGVPVVTTDPPPEAVDTVLAVPSRDPEALCEALALSGDDALRARLVQGARRHAVAAPEPGAQAARFRDLYRDVLADD